jgi:hypothetical protein
LDRESTIGIISSARESSEYCVKQGAILVECVDLHEADIPLGVTDCKFGKWLESHRVGLNNFIWYMDLQKSFDKFHKVYCELYYGAVRKYNPKTKDQLEQCFMRLKIESKILSSKLDGVKNQLLELSDTDFKERYAIPEIKITAKELIEKRRLILKKCHQNINFPSVISEADLLKERKNKLQQKNGCDQKIININLQRLDEKLALLSQQVA